MKKTLALFILLLTSFFVKAQTTQDYIAEHVDYAQKLMRIYQVPASIILGVAIHESAAGKSKIARYLNNHFGVKGPNSSNEIRSSYRDYPTVDSSYSHFVSFLRDRTYYNVLFTKYDQYDYKNWARGIQRGGYASSRTWASQVIALIKKYELYKYDDRPDDYMETVIPATNIVAKSTRSNRTKSRSSIAKKSKSYTIKSGENLNQIAERNGTTSTALMRKNGLKSAVVQPGQKLKL